jgi:hypothetical protein
VGITDKTEMSKPSATATVDDRPGDLVPTLDELALEVGDEDPEVRVPGAWVHLRDEEDPQRATRA